MTLPRYTDLHPPQTSQQINCQRWKHAFGVALLPLVFWAVQIYQVVGRGADQDGSLPIVFGVMLTCVCPMVYLRRFSVQLPNQTGGLLLAWASPKSSILLVDLCRQHEDLDEYRQLVIGQGRRFTYEELQSMLEWPEKRQQLCHEQCKQQMAEQADRELYAAGHALYREPVPVKESEHER